MLYCSTPGSTSFPNSPDCIIILFLECSIPSKDVGEVVISAEADTSCHILDFCHNNFFPVALMAMILKFLKFQ